MNCYFTLVEYLDACAISIDLDRMALIAQELHFLSAENFVLVGMRNTEIGEKHYAFRADVLAEVFKREGF